MTEPTNANLGESVSRFVGSVCDAVDELGASEDVVCEIKAYGEAVADDVTSRVDELEAEKEELREENTDLRDHVEELENNQDEYEMRLDALSSWVDGLADNVAELDDDVGEMGEAVKSMADGTGAVSMDTAGAGINYDEYTTVEKYSLMSDEEREKSLSASEQRAVETFRNFFEWSDSVPAGRTVDTTDLRKLLDAKRDETLESKQILRTCRALARLSDEKIVLNKTERHGYQLLQPKKHSFASRQAVENTTGSSNGVTASSA